MAVDIYSEKQAQLVFQIVEQIFDNLVLILIPDNGGHTKVVCVVLTSSEGDKKSLDLKGKTKNIPSALSYLKRQYFVPIELEVPEQFEHGNKSHGNNVLKLAILFAKLNMLLKNAPSS
ncbi:hypothetical protein IEQ34_004832 [Dendrobium chrysotoxum]|uniref:Uncharacterized protein n=1 Tax=Dendrobium chrysotoxum TaxID=161865 RepID=A0AAV7GTD8_DENCH|nr:hypothetical protein IEQ34_004832 [Dendrobium chrysotoxum]